MIARPATSHGPRAHQPFNSLKTHLWADQTLPASVALGKKAFRGHNSSALYRRHLRRQIGRYLTIKNYTEAHCYTVAATKDRFYDWLPHVTMSFWPPLFEQTYLNCRWQVRFLEVGFCGECLSSRWATLTSRWVGKYSSLKKTIWLQVHENKTRRDLNWILVKQRMTYISDFTYNVKVLQTTMNLISMEYSTPGYSG